MILGTPSTGTSLYQMMSRSIFEKCNDALKQAPTLKLAVLATAPALMMFMAGAGIESSHRIDLMTEGAGIMGNVTKAGASAYKAYMASTEALPLMDAVKKGLTGGYETIGNNLSMAGIGATAAFPSLAIIAKATAHISAFAKERFGIGQAEDQSLEINYDTAPR
ncbi:MULTISPECIES: hypothetical protein [Pseudomonas syringae group]|uniref:hypothetical protein n=1 Tax=Pseudomonas syringae group TaxID=136849 RepID=UPI0006B890D1|nr:MULTISPECIES: hypothetical protein [Pseudomonas syringae group]